jgi:hypothetical protein
MKSVETIANEVLRCALSWERDARLLGDVTAEEIAILAISAIITCPICGATAWANIDCDVCSIAVSLLKRREESHEA